MSDTTQNQPQLTLYNSLTRKKEVFTPQNPERVTMYNCGPTVYSYAHIGNARAAVVADVLFRVLRHIYGEEHVVYARNITDVDDKIITSAKEQGVDISVITEKYAKIYNDDLTAIGCLPPTVQPKCTDHIGNMVSMISDLIDKGFAYESDGHVFFDVSKYDDYGKLSGNTLENLRGGDRVGEGEVARKRNAADFVLWKPPLEGVGWDAPFGNGRPGWHIECSAMAKAELTDGTESETIDIHCGGVDLKFPHHENEIAQSSCCHGGEPLANYWVHNEFLNMGTEKMSKSLGNVKLIRDLLENWDGEVIRLALLKANFDSELHWNEELLIESKLNLDKWYGTLQKVQKFLPKYLKYVRKSYVSQNFSDKLLVNLDTVFSFRYLYELQRKINLFFHDVDAYLDVVMAVKLEYSDRIDKFNFSNEQLSAYKDFAKYNSYNTELYSFLYSEKNHLSKRQHTPASQDIPKLAIRHFLRQANLLGLLQKDPEDWFKGGMDTDKFDALVKEYDAVRADALAAKAAGDKAAMGAAFGRSDEIRDELKAQGIAIETGPDGSAWRKA